VTSHLRWRSHGRADLRECYRQESLLNVAFDDGRPWRLVCLYDRDALIETAHRSHPIVTDESVTQENDVQADGWPFGGELSSPPGDAQEVAFKAEELGVLRHLLSQWAASHKLGTEASEELVLAVNELTTNSVRYGGGSGLLALWRERDTLLCEVRDAGHIEDPQVGRRRPRPDQHSGRGIWLVHQLCDVVQIRSSPRGTTVRVHKHLGAPRS